MIIKYFIIDRFSTLQRFSIMENELIVSFLQEAIFVVRLLVKPAFTRGGQ